MFDFFIQFDTMNMTTQDAPYKTISNLMIRRAGLIWLTNSSTHCVSFQFGNANLLRIKGCIFDNIALYFECEFQTVFLVILPTEDYFEYKFMFRTKNPSRGRLI